MEIMTRCFRSLRTERVLAVALCTFALFFLLLSLHTAPAPCRCGGLEAPLGTPGAVTWPPPPARPPPARCRANTSVAALPDFPGQPPHVRDFLLHRHCRDFPLLQDAPLGKCAQPVFLLLVIKSSPSNYERRELVRRTWGRERQVQGAPLRRLFLVGTAPEPKEARKVNRLLAMEARAHGDILQWDFHDSFFNLTLKQVGWPLFFLPRSPPSPPRAPRGPADPCPLPTPSAVYMAPQVHFLSGRRGGGEAAQAGQRLQAWLQGPDDPGLNSGSVLPFMTVHHLCASVSS